MILTLTELRNTTINLMLTASILLVPLLDLPFLHLLFCPEEFLCTVYTSITRIKEIWNLLLGKKKFSNSKRSGTIPGQMKQPLKFKNFAQNSRTYPFSQPRFGICPWPRKEGRVSGMAGSNRRRQHPHFSGHAAHVSRSSPIPQHTRTGQNHSWFSISK